MRLTEYWRLKEERYSLKGSRDKNTHEVNFPARPVAPREVEVYEFDTDATETNAETHVPSLAKAV